jgi:hypothetical protein
VCTRRAISLRAAGVIFPVDDRHASVALTRRASAVPRTTDRVTRIAALAATTTIPAPHRRPARVPPWWTADEVVPGDGLRFTDELCFT